MRSTGLALRVQHSRLRVWGLTGPTVSRWRLFQVAPSKVGFLLGSGSVQDGGVRWSWQKLRILAARLSRKIQATLFPLLS